MKKADGDNPESQFTLDYPAEASPRRRRRTKQGGASRTSGAFTWGGNTLPALPAHSEQKLLLYARYTFRYVIRTGKVPAQKHHSSYKLVIADGFAGGGMYSDGELGSPLIVMEAVRKALDEIMSDPGVVKAKRAWKPSILVSLNDHSRGAIQQLTQNIAASGLQGDSRFSIRTSSLPFEEWLGKLVADVKRHQRSGHKAVIFLDPCGFSQVLPKHVRYIFDELEHSEVILTFPVGQMLNHTTGGISPAHWAKNAGYGWVREDIRKDLLARNLTLESERVLLKDLVGFMALQTGASDYSCLTLVPNRGLGDNQQKLWVLHLTRSPGGEAARDEMVGAHWEGEKASLYRWSKSPEDYLNVRGLRKDSTEDMFPTETLLLREEEREDLQRKIGEDLLAELTDTGATETAGGILVSDSISRRRNRAALTRSDIREGLWAAVRDDNTTKVIMPGGRERPSGSNHPMTEDDKIVHTGQLWFLL